MPAGVFRGIPENRRTQPLQSMAAGFVFCPATAGGSGHCPSRQRRPSIHEEFRGFADLGRSSLWRPTVVDRTRGSNRVQAQPARRQQVAPGTARRRQVAVGNADLQFAGSSCEFADLGRSNLWRPMVVARTGGSRWLSALPTGSKWVQAQPARLLKVYYSPLDFCSLFMRCVV